MRRAGPARIILGTFEFDVIRVGGMGTLVTTLAQALDQRAYQPVVVMPRSGHAVPWKKLDSRALDGCEIDIYDHDGVEVWLLSNAMFDTVIYPDTEDVVGPEGEFLKGVEFGTWLGKLLPALEADVLHLHDAFGWMALSAARAQRLPSILTIHALHEQYPPIALDEHRAADRADVVTTVSESYAREREGFFRPPRRTRVVPNGIDLSRWQPDAAPEGQAEHARAERLRALLAPRSLPMAPTFAYVGRLDPYQKGIDVLLAAYRRLKAEGLVDFNLLLYGDGEPEVRAAATALAAEDPGHVAFTPGLAAASKVREIFGCVDVVIIPSLYEPFGLIQLEALAMGSLVVASRTGGLRDVMIEVEHEGGFGRLVTPGSDAELAAALLELSAMRRTGGANVARLRALGAARAQQFSARAMAAKYEQLYDELRRSTLTPGA